MNWLFYNQGLTLQPKGSILEAQQHTQKDTMKLIACLIAIMSLAACGPTVKPDDQVTTRIKGWERAGFGLVAMANFNIVNNTDHAVKDIKIRCGGYTESKTRIDENVRVIYRTIPAHGQIRINAFNMGYVHDQVNILACLTTEFSVVDK